MALLYILRLTVHATLDILSLLMLFTCIMSLVTAMTGSERCGRIYEVLCAFTEPVIYPVRLIFDKFGWADGMVIDVPFFVTYLIISILSMIL